MDTIMKLFSPQYSVPASASFTVMRLFFVMTVVIDGGGAIPPLFPTNDTTIPAVIVFGDSIVDAGNNNNLTTIAPVKCNFPPYGRDFIGGKPTGRFSNGRVPSDMVAEAFNVKKIVPAYLDPNVQLEDLLTGVTFASGGAGYDPQTSNLVSVISLTDQLKLFKEYKNKLTAAVGEERTANIISKSVYFVCFGSNDIVNTYFSNPSTQLHYDVPAYADLLVKNAATFLQELYGEGARRIGVLSLPPLGCVPSQRTVRGGIQRNCWEPLNQASTVVNTKISSKLNSLNKNFPEATFLYLDIYNPLLSLIQYPAKYGFEVATLGCCGTGIIEVSVLCNSYAKNTCKDASRYVFWDSFHPSEKAYDTLVHIVLNNPN
ncbi:GDSL esterase/lipase EXL3-like [Ziziphus jujuba]|uniref:GDSL esterase/lipase EXL3-like n=1 Tax=Ziziphus jujuba TaxID=326968 RepID=A0A6P4AUH5_ZIZJJ|nr:GDSL esterase/lipase EXL3-like [Ziziphus jujuba]